MVLYRLTTWTEAVGKAIEHRPIWALGAFSIVYFACAVWLAAIKPMWADEFFTYYIAHQDSVKGIWTALHTGADQHPPTFYILARTFFPVLGPNALALRIPELIGYWVMSLALYHIVTRWTSPAFGLLAMCLPLITRAYEYAFEARAYALMLAFSATAYMSWQAARHEKRSRLSVIGLGLSSVCLLASHYYGIFALMPIALAEASRTILRRRVDAWIWAALAAGAVPILVFYPVLSDAREWGKTFWAKPEWSGVAEFYGFLLSPTAVSIVAVLTALGVSAITIRRSRLGLQSSLSLNIGVDELVGVVGLIAIPLIAVAGARLAHGGFAPRYALPAVVGCSLLFGATAYAVLAGNRSVALGLAALVGACFVGVQARESQDARATARSLARTGGWILANSDPHLPVVAWHSQGFLQLSYYAPAQLRERITYLASPDAARRHLGHDTVDRGFLALRPWFPPGIVDFQSFKTEHTRFIAYGYTGDLAETNRTWNWLLPELVQDGANVRLLGAAGDEMLFLVETGRFGKQP